jgi:tRNA(fMet)-specific endonuclease VapC
MNGRSPAVRNHFDQLHPDDIAVCSVVVAELFYGAMKSRDPAVTMEKQRLFLAPYISLPFDDIAAFRYGKLRAELETIGTPIGGNDTQIAAIAISHNLTLVTHNGMEFKRVAGLKFEDWEK